MRLRMAVSGGAIVPDSPRVSVFVTCYNCAKHIARTVEAVLANDFTDFELLLAEGGSTDSTLEVLEGLAARDPRVRVLSGVAPPQAAKLNAMLKAARGSLLVSCDDDCTASPGWIRAYVEGSAKWPGMLAGRVLPDGDGVPLGVKRTMHVEVWPPSFYNKAMPWRRCRGLNFAVPTAIARGIGGWDEGANYAVDMDFALRLMLAGHTIVYLPDALVYHKTLPDWAAFVKKRAHGARAGMRHLSRKYPLKLHAWCSIAIAFGWWTATVFAGLVTFRPSRVRLGWASLCGGFKGLFGPPPSSGHTSTWGKKGTFNFSAAKK